MTAKLTVQYPMVPGNPTLKVAEFDSMEAAQEYANETARRRKDLRGQDIEIRLGRDGRRVGKAFGR